MSNAPRLPPTRVRSRQAEQIEPLAGSVGMDDQRNGNRGAVSAWIREHGPLVTSVGLAGSWGLLARATPGRTYHFAPVVVAAAWPAARRALAGRVDARRGLRAAVSGLGVALLVTLALAGVGALDGPALVGDSTAAESMVAAFAGAFWGLRIATRARPGLFTAGSPEAVTDVTP